MKKVKFPLLIQIIPLLLLGCKSSSVDKKIDGIRYKETVTINEVPRASLTFFDVSDSRCPEGSQCIWAGNATVDLELTGVTSEGRITEHIKMCLGSCNRQLSGPDTLNHTFAGQQYRFILNAVNIDPNMKGAAYKEAYYINLQIEKK